MKTMEKITSILVNSGILQLDTSFSFTGQSEKRNPFAGFLSKAARLVANVVAGCRAAVRLFENHPDKVNLLLSYTTMDFSNPTLRENCLLCVKYLTEQSETIRRRLSELTFIDMSPETKLMMEKLGLTKFVGKS